MPVFRCINTQSPQQLAFLITGTLSVTVTPYRSYLYEPNVNHPALVQLECGVINMDNMTITNSQYITDMDGNKDHIKATIDGQEWTVPLD